MKLKINLIKLACGLTLLGATLPVSAQETWYFYQAGWINGGVISGTFTGTDGNSDGQLDFFDKEISNFTISMTGSSIVPDGYNWEQSQLAGIVYDINGGPFLGDGQTGDMEGFGVNDVNYKYLSGYGPNNTPGGGLYDSEYSLVDATPDPIMVSTTPITDEIYQENLGSYNFPSSVPEPTTLALTALGGLGLLLKLRRRK